VHESVESKSPTGLRSDGLQKVTYLACPATREDGLIVRLDLSHMHTDDRQHASTNCTVLDERWKHVMWLGVP
jgi:hypothetical protein